MPLGHHLYESNGPVTSNTLFCRHVWLPQEHQLNKCRPTLESRTLHEPALEPFRNFVIVSMSSSFSISVTMMSTGPFLLSGCIVFLAVRSLSTVIPSFPSSSFCLLTSFLNFSDHSLHPCHHKYYHIIISTLFPTLPCLPGMHHVHTTYSEVFST